MTSQQKQERKLREAWAGAFRKALAPLVAPTPVRLCEWAEKHFYLSAESSYVEGTWRAWPFQRAMLDCMGHDDIREVVVVKSARVGYTKMLLACIGYYAEHRHRNQGLWQPTDDDADDFVKTELDPMLRDMPAMRGIFPSYLRRTKGNTLRQKQFLGSLLHIRGGKAAKNYRRLTLDAAYLDEVDAFDLDIENEGSPVSLSAKRIEGATFPKHILGSTPKLKGFSLTEARAQQAVEQFKFYVPCPSCGVEHVLRWGDKDAPYGFKWRDDDPETVAHLCEACGTLYTQADYFGVWTKGRYKSPSGCWIDPQGDFRDAQGNLTKIPPSVAFHVWTAYSPQAAWVDIVRQWLAAVDKARAGDKSELKTFVNTTLGESYEEEAERADEHELQRRAEDYQLRTVPDGGLLLVCGVDVQDDRFECVVWAIGRGEEMWAVDYTVLTANPADERDWDKLDSYLKTSFRHASGIGLKIEAAGIDTGGHFTHQAYAFCRTRTARRIYAIKGDHREGQPVKGRSSMQDVNWRGKIIKAGVKLWHVGTDTAKDLLFGRLKVTQPGPGYVHFSRYLAPEFFTQLTSESRMLQRTARGELYRWVKRGAVRNEVLDATVYALFASHMRDVHKYTDGMWGRLRAKVLPKDAPAMPEEIEEPAAAPVVMPTPPAAKWMPTRNRGSRFSSWYRG